LTEIRTLQ